MIEIEIPKDIRTYETKLIGPLTTRQLFCVIGLAGSCFLTYKAAVNLLGEDSSLIWFFPMVVAIPFALIGWVKPYGLTFEKFARSVFRSMFLAPAKRVYKIKNLHDEFDKIIDEEEKLKEGNPQKSKKGVLKNGRK